MLMANYAVGGESSMYSDYAQSFLKASVPVMQNYKSGWYTGRCVTRREPMTEKAGALVLIDKDGTSSFKQIIPASSLRSEVDYFDDIDDEEYEVYKDEIYEQANSPAKNKYDSLHSDLYYGILIGALYTRQLGNDLIVTLTNYEESPTVKDSGHFFCKFTKMVRAL